MSECVASRVGASASELALGPNGVSERPLAVRLLAGAGCGLAASPSVAHTRDEIAVSELRALRVGRQRLR